MKGRLGQCYTYWEKIGANKTVLRVIKKGYRIPFLTLPEPVFLKNNRSAREHGDFVQEAILELLASGRIKEMERPPLVVNPLTVSAKGDKKRLVLDLRHVNRYVHKQKIKIDDWRVMEHFVKTGGYLFSFDIKQGYHHIEMDPDCIEYLGFSWEFNGRIRYFVFLVLPFGLTSASFLFTKVIRPLIKHWRRQSIKICCFIDDGCGSGDDQQTTRKHSIIVRETLAQCGFVTNDKSIWEPTQEITWVGYTVNLQNGTFRTSPKRVASLEKSLKNVMEGLPYLTARGLSKIAGKIMSTKWVLGNITHLKTRHMYNMIDNRFAWDKRMSINYYPQVIHELAFWRKNFNDLNVKPIRSYRVPDVVIASDASATGLGAHTRVGTKEMIVHKNFSPEEADTSSTHKEVYAIMYALVSFKHFCKDKSVLWFTDNFGASRVVPKGSGVPALQEMAEKIHSICESNAIILEVQWVPREAIFYADYLSKLIDHDDWRTTQNLFAILDRMWGPFTIDRFADSSNTKLKRFNSKYLCPNTEQVDSFTSAWTGENNFIVPPVSLVPRALAHMEASGAQGTIVVPFWPSAAFFPLIRKSGNEFQPFIKEAKIFKHGEGEWLQQGANKTVFIGSEQFQSDVLALLVQF